MGCVTARPSGSRGAISPSRGSLVALADYDTSFHSLNAAMLLGTLQLPARWSLNFDAERRNSPILTTENALIGQPFTNLLQLEQTFTTEQIYQLARDRTPADGLLQLSRSPDPSASASSCRDGRGGSHRRNDGLRRRRRRCPPRDWK